MAIATQFPCGVGKVKIMERFEEHLVARKMLNILYREGQCHITKDRRPFHPKCQWHPRGKQKFIYVPPPSCTHSMDHLQIAKHNIPRGKARPVRQPWGSPGDTDPVEPGIVPALVGLLVPESAQK